MNSEGIVLEYSSEPFQKSDEIIAGINAHYGTSFYQEDDIDKDFTIGETMPNWNAYEKIGLPQKQNVLFKTQASGQNYWGAILTGSENECTIEMIVNENGYLYEIIDTGVVHGYGYATLNDSVKNLITGTLSGLGYNVTNISGKTEQIESGETWPQYGGYEILN